MKVSVVVPVYNMEKYLDQFMQSVLAQTIDDFEVICVDDGSTDSTLEMLHSYEKSDPRVRVITQKNQYSGVARNNGIKIATGEYIAFFDPDDFYDADMLKVMYDACEETGAEMCACAARLYDDSTGEFSPCPLVVPALTPKRAAFRAADLGKNAFRFTSSGPPNKLFKRDFIEKNGIRYAALPVAQDLPFICLAEALANRVTVCIDKPYYSYRVGTGTNAQARTFKWPLSCATAHTILRDSLVQAGVFDVYKKAYENFAAFEIERYSKRYRFSPEAFKAYHDWYLEKGREIYDIHLSSLDAGTLSNLLMTFDGVTPETDSETAREIVVKNAERFKDLYAGHGKQRAKFMFKKLAAMEGAPRAILRMAGFAAEKAIAKFTCRG